MKLTLATLNSKYIHTNLALYLLESAVEDLAETNIKEFTIKEDYHDIVSELVTFNSDLYCFSIYIWNVTQTFEVIRLLKEKLPNIKILIGGPEVSYDQRYFIETYPQIDFLISGEGETIFRQLVKNDLDPTSLNISTKDKVLSSPNQANLNFIESSCSPYHKLKDIKNRLVYFEASRGCPYSCSFCLSSLEKGVRFYNIEYLKNELLYLIENGVKTVKFLDRTFNTKLEFAYQIFDFIIKHHKSNQSFQFEITGDILPTEIIDYLNENAPKGLFRFEIGIQSTNQETNNLVDRNQDLDILLTNIVKIQEAGVIDLHLDLIAGLPKEDLKSFEKTFNDIFAIKPLELQLGFLKMLRGTKIRNQANLHFYKYQTESPYEIISHSHMSEDDLFKIHLAEEGLEKYWNKHKTDRAINYLANIKQNYFQLFYEIGLYWFDNYQIFTNFQSHDLYQRLALYGDEKYQDSQVILDLVKFDYLINSKIKPKRFYETLDKKSRNAIFSKLLKDSDLFKANDLYKYSYLEELVINPLTYVQRECYLIVNFQNETSYYLFDKVTLKLI